MPEPDAHACRQQAIRPRTLRNEGEGHDIALGDSEARLDEGHQLLNAETAALRRAVRGGGGFFTTLCRVAVTGGAAFLGAEVGDGIGKAIGAGGAVAGDPC